ncbi:hypothetical protein IMAU80627_01742 [Lactobacillus helveticus]|uniref:Uncharacterized protein n=1 Tax=Lactobacillus helveticus CIRM-BIA 953 TaxID=1226335 RepID=U4QFX1_LACHE|nr:hypothetical protein [Lactobacillus helveticus]CDI43477.1 Protein of unknown function [Lactobacillus helveticus CIRM-BIA 953]NRN77040.1 hypothetical protein [Lactobacillus helveticus]NRN90129.1 hypothetical protein [Lactobacillus helveticus]NRN93884.1 hypothetical protein [Lactobacillus helveticus]
MVHKEDENAKNTKMKAIFLWKKHQRGYIVVNI